MPATTGSPCPRSIGTRQSGCKSLVSRVTTWRARWFVKGMSFWVWSGLCSNTGQSEPESQINLDDVILVDWIHLRDVLVAAASSQVLIDAFGIAITNRADQVIGKTVGESRIDPLQVAAAFKKVRIQEIGIQCVLLDMLPVSPELPAILSGSASVHQAQAVLVANGKPHLISLNIIPLR